MVETKSVEIKRVAQILDREASKLKRTTPFVFDMRLICEPKKCLLFFEFFFFFFGALCQNVKMILTMIGMRVCFDFEPQSGKMISRGACYVYRW